MYVVVFLCYYIMETWPKLHQGHKSLQKWKIPLECCFTKLIEFWTRFDHRVLVGLGAQKMTKKENGRKENDLHMTFMIFYKENDRKNMTENK